jgi:hypothetical protein
MLDYKDLTKKLDLSAEDQKELDILLEKMPPIDREDLLGLLAENPEMGQMVVDNFRKKKEVFQSGDKDAIDQLVKEEQEAIESFS